MRRLVAVGVLGLLGGVATGCSDGKALEAEEREACIRSFPDQIGAPDERSFPDYLARCMDSAVQNRD